MKLILSAVTILLIAGTGYFFWQKSSGLQKTVSETQEQNIDQGEADPNPHLLSIESLRSENYPGSEIVIEQTLDVGSNYQRFVASYKSEGLKIYALLTVPNGNPPAGGWPAIVFNHGYIQPKEYTTAGKYVAYTDGFSRNGYVLIKPDFRGHGNSEGEATGGYGSNGYTIDVLNAVASIKKLQDPSTSSGRFIVNEKSIGMWGHSMGGFITLRSMVVSEDIKAGVIWGGVVGSYADLLNNWRRSNFSPPPLPSGARRWRQQLTEQFGTPQQNPTFWNSISANSFLGDISGPLSLHHGTSDASVPVDFSKKLEQQMKAAGKEVELFTYAGDDHNLSSSFDTAMNRSIEFFDENLK